MRRMHTVIALAVGACFLGYFLVGELAYASHPNVSSNVLDSYDKGDATMTVATIFMGFSAIASFPVNHHAARARWTTCSPRRSVGKSALPDNANLSTRDANVRVRPRDHARRVRGH